MTPRTLIPAFVLVLTTGCSEKPRPSGNTSGTGTASAAATAAPSASATASATATASASASASAAPSAATRTWSFDGDKASEPPAGFQLVKTGGKAGKWVVKAEGSAPSGPNVLAQLDDDRTEARFALALANDVSARDARVSVRCRMVSGKVEQACGVVARWKDEKSYYLARVNGLDKDVNVYVVKDGKRQKLGGWKGATIGDAWHTIQLEVQGEKLVLSWDGTPIFEASDKTWTDAGRAGVWIRADSVTYFDDFAVTPLD